MKIKMKKSPEADFNFEVCELMKDVKIKYLATPKKQPPQPTNEYRGIYPVPELHGTKIWLEPGDGYAQRRNIIYTLEEKGAFKVLDESLEDLSDDRKFTLEILQPKFDAVYAEYCTAGTLEENPIERSSQQNVRLSHLPEIVIDMARGIGRRAADGIEHWARAVNPRTKIFKVVVLLLGTEGPMTKANIERKLKWNRRQITRGIKGLNANARENLGIKYDLIKNIPVSCELNQERFLFLQEGAD